MIWRESLRLQATSCAVCPKSSNPDPGSILVLNLTRHLWSQYRELLILQSITGRNGCTLDEAHRTNAFPRAILGEEFVEGTGVKLGLNVEDPMGPFRAFPIVNQDYHFPHAMKSHPNEQKIGQLSMSAHSAS